MQNDDNFLITRAEVEARFGISKRFLELAIGRGDGPPAVRIGRSVRYRVGDIVSWIEAQTVGGTHAQ